jgi:hypothetical protein
MSNLLKLKNAWHDVWTKAAATLLATGLLAGGSAILSSAVREYLGASSLVPHWVALLGATLLFLAIIVAVARRPKPRVKIKLINVYHHVAPTNLDSKVYCVMRNDSNRAVDVQISKYIPNELKVVSPNAIAALQLKFQPDGDPCPQKAVERVAVFPGQRFTAWIAPDETLFKEALFDRLRSKMGTGEMGTLVLNVDDQEYSMPL